MLRCSNSLQNNISTMVRPFQPLTSIYDAKRLLSVSSEDDSLRPTKENIQKAFVRSALKYHPDSRHRRDAQPCAVKFRRCVHARDLLLHHYVGPSRSRPVNPSSFYTNNNTNTNKQHAGAHRDHFAKGFPFQTLRLLTLKQKLAIRGTIVALVSALALYDKWVRVENQRRRAEEDGRVTT
jgi:6-pyruvoyl-tetrahydropterin synthase